MSLRRFLTKNRKVENDRPSNYTSNVTTTPSHTLPGRDSVRQPEHSLTDTLGVAEASQAATPGYIYYRIYAEDGAIPTKTPVTPGDPFVGRIKARSVPPPRTVKAVKCSIAKVENIKDRESTTLFLTSCSQSPMDDTDKVIFLNGTGPGSTLQEPLALVAKMSNSERSALESARRGGLASAADPDATIQYLYYLLYADDYEIPSKVAFDPEGPSLGRIRADSVAPPHSPTSIKQCISRVEGNSAFAYADLFADTSSDSPLKEGHISILHTDGPGLSPNDPMAIVQRPQNEPMAIDQLKSLSIPDGRYVIKNRAADICWGVYDSNPIKTVYFYSVTIANAKKYNFYQWDITQDTTNGNISMKSPYGASSESWVGAEITGSTVPVPWRLIPADNKSYYLTTNIMMNRYSQNQRVPAAQGKGSTFGSMDTLKEGDQWQMWEFIRI